MPKKRHKQVVDQPIMIYNVVTQVLICNTMENRIEQHHFVCPATNWYCDNNIFLN